MTNIYDQNEQHPVLNFVNDAVISHSQTIAIPTAMQLLYPWRAGLVPKGFDFGRNSSLECFVKFGQSAGSRGSEFDLIGHPNALLGEAITVHRCFHLAGGGKRPVSSLIQA